MTHHSISFRNFTKFCYELYKVMSVCVCCVYKVKELESRISTLEMDKRTLTENLDEKIGQYQKVSTVCVEPFYTKPRIKK